MTQKETWKEHLAGVRQTLRCGRIAEARAALDALRDAGVVPEPEQWRIHELYGAVFHDLADAEGAAAAYFRAAAADRYLRSQREHFSNYLFALHYLPNLAADELAGQHRRYALLFAARRCFRRVSLPRIRGCASVFCPRILSVRRRLFFTPGC